ncbi:SNARE domain- containing protein [Aspergillus lucknowensis]|uniref:t-SNARE coiled-coil homology domain-containing protein n=1 Tax=Aspergillus lucknowensis TaxID=176173 RepID=A0ABR4LJI5_9EURO
MASRLHRREPRASSSLFDSYGGDSRPASKSPGSVGGYGYGGYPGAGTGAPMNGSGNGNGTAGGYRAATPNAKCVLRKTVGERACTAWAREIWMNDADEYGRYRGHYSDAVLSHLESQNDEEVEGITAKVKMLKDITLAIGDEIRDTTHISELNDSFENTRTRIRGNMNRMLRMAERTGVGWKVWVGFFAAVFLIFFYVWIT